MKVRFVASCQEGIPCVVGVYADKTTTLPENNTEILQAIQALKFKGEASDTASCVLPSGRCVLLVGLGKKERLATKKDWMCVGGKIAACVMGTVQEEEAFVCLSDEHVEMAALGALLRSWRFAKYHTAARPIPTPTCTMLSFCTPSPEARENTFASTKHIADAVGWARELMEEPGNILYPESFAERLSALSSLGLDVEIVTHEALKTQGFGALLGVGQGSTQPPCLAILSWKGGQKGEPPLAFVGKGITFDSGGISIKPSSGMEEMKMDMGGAAVVCGLMRLLALRKARVNAVCVVALAENMPSGSAQRPGDIVTSLSGQTIEIQNTDAEGRLILADALWYTQNRFNPKAIIDVATLTGAAKIALGTSYAGLLSNNDALATALCEAGEETGEQVWRLPLCEDYDRALDSDIADIKNITDGSVGGGTIVAAQFLQRFVNKKTWAHLDIAALDYVRRPTALLGKGANAFGIRLLDQWVRTQEH